MPQRGDPGLTFAGFLILAALGAALWKGGPLETARPTSSQAGWYEHADIEVPARLWQDPFKAIYAHLTAGSGVRTPVRQDIQAEIEAATSKDGDRLTLLVAMVSPGSYAELEERRRRRRYALLSALGDSGFVPRDAETIGAFYFPSRTVEQRKQSEAPLKIYDIGMSAAHSVQTGENSRSTTDFIPYEWYDYENPEPAAGKQKPRSAVLVLWLDESRLQDRPFGYLRKLLETLLKSHATREKVTTIVLGPARSNTLRTMIDGPRRERGALQWLQDRGQSGSKMAGFHILSPAATVADRDLLRDRGEEISKRAEKSAASKIPCGEESLQKRTGLPIIRTICSDDALIARLVDELVARGIDPKHDYAVVLSEWDTYFGRSLPRAFAVRYCGSTEGCPKLLRFSYERGIDGIALGAEKLEPQPGGSETTAQPKQQAGFPFAANHSIRHPLGTAQFDYLRRLASKIADKNRELRLEKGRGIRAVAILGSDVYDKLLILRALRPLLPGVVWVTTDLDALLFHPAELQWTRNLVIASTYDLHLSETNRSSTSPFRDSYQTSFYLAARLAVDKSFLSDRKLFTKPIGGTGLATLSQEKLYRLVSPQLFEVGRHGAVSLPGAEEYEQAINRTAPKSFSATIATATFFLAALGIFSLHQLRPRSGRPVLAFSGLLAAFAALTVIALRPRPEREPFSLLAGVSIWPTEYIRLVAVFLSLFFIWLVFHSLRRNWQMLNARYFVEKAWQPPAGLTLSELVKRLHLTVRRPEPWVMLSIFLVSSVTLILGILAKRSLPLPQYLVALALSGVTIVVFWWLAIMGKIWQSISVRSINQWMASPPQTDAHALWEEYSAQGETQHRFLRSTSLTLIYVFFAAIVSAVFGRPEVPCRGESCMVDHAIIGISVLVMLFLLFLVLDATRLCACWIDRVSERHLDWRNTKHPNLPAGHAEGWVKMHLIGERTAEVSRLIYYPVLIFLLMLLARSTYFDDWGFPQALAIIVGVNFLLALACAVHLNYVAQSARSRILDELRQEQLQLAATESGEPTPKATRQEVRDLIEQLEKLRIGAFQHIWDQPIVRATLLLLGGVGITYSEYLPWP